ncbi:MAG: Asp-tRNA(Asn)/Glu-tRNA(Gln) amidotransferase subunit GatB [Candidatus Omnitrophota bacterium]
MKKEFETVIGLEVHLQLATESKIFCGCANTFGQDPNSQTCPVCLGLPGALPVLNQKALELAIKVALGLNCQVNSLIKFDRKNYYYPDLPKAYQISQYDQPIAHDGYIQIFVNGQSKTIRIHRAHLEEDAGKLIHDPKNRCSLVDYNRTGSPLMEIVTEPDLRSAQEAYDYLTMLKLTLQYLDVSDCDMEKGSLRCDANISIREMGEKTLGVKIEIKNMNSFKAVKNALDYEINRQTDMKNANEPMTQETRLWDEQKQVTLPMRSKEEAHDYRYFPEPDLVPFMVEPKAIEEIGKTLGESPTQKYLRLQKDYSLSDYDAQILIQDRNLSDFFESCAKLFPQTKKICNWINGPVLQELNARKIPITAVSLSPKKLISIIEKVEGGALSNLAGKDVLKLVIDTGKNVDEIIAAEGLAQVSDDASLNKIVDEILRENDKIIQQIKDGKDSAIGFLVGQAMKKSKGKANPKKIGEMIKGRIQNG